MSITLSPSMQIAQVFSVMRQLNFDPLSNILESMFELEMA